MELIKISLVSLFATLFCIWMLRPIALKIGFVDRPGGRKLHHEATPLIGGVSMFFGFCLGLLTLHYSLQPYRGLLAGSALLLLMGVVDDFKELGSRLRLIGQIFAAFLLIGWGNLSVENLGNIFFLGDVHLGIWAYMVTVIAVVGFINAMNMMDGQDGLSGGIALGQVLLLMVLAYLLHLQVDIVMLMIVAVVLLAFLSFNMPLPWRKKAAIFIGDSGITFIAFVIAWFAVHISQVDTARISPVTVLWVLAFPLFDLISVVIYRIRTGRSPLAASRDHFHHILSVMGMSTSLSTFMMCLLSCLIGATGIVLDLHHVPEGWQFIGLIVLLLIYLCSIKFVRRTGF